jgi:hypothetical protein
MLASQAVKVGIGAAAGVCLVLALIAVVPPLRTRVEATANSRSGAANLANAPLFQVEVADLDNRRWILRSGGDAASPFAETPTRRERQSEAPSSSRNESAKSSRSKESHEPTESVNTPQPGELALSRPVAKETEAASVQLIAPSIFGGITRPSVR